MKNKTDLSHSVMDRVVRMEERQTRIWRIKFIAVLCGLLAVFGLGIYRIIQYFNEYQLFAFFDLFKEDREIISEYWQDTVMTVWDESPKGLLLFGLCVCGMIILSILVTRRKRNIVKKKLEQISAYRSKSAK
jgi:uncharacterized integral membrane protein